MSIPFKTYRLIISDSSSIIYNHGFGEQYYKILKLSNDSLILIDGEIEKYIRVIN